MIPVATGALGGILRGLATAGVYAVILCLEMAVSDFVKGNILHVNAPNGVDDVLFLLLFLGVFVGMLSVLVGAIGGLVFGMALVPVVNAWTRSRRTLAVITGVVFAVAGLVVFPSIPLGSERVSDLEELLTLKVLPALLAGGAAAWHVVALHRAKERELSPAAPPAAAPHAPPRGAASDA